MKEKIIRLRDHPYITTVTAWLFSFFTSSAFDFEKAPPLQYIIIIVATAAYTIFSKKDRIHKKF